MNERFKVQSLVDTYLDYFRDRGHEVVPSAPLLPTDPTLLFTAAGMVPFKSYYGAPDDAPYSRAASVQKCLRAGGKQSDLENVGRTLRHHTFFEMLGNFSFGDYFKKEAIEWGWDLSVNVWGLDPQRIWVSVFESDDEAADLWHQHIGVPRERIVRLGRADNFWGPVGDTGVCGPSSELHYDTGRPGADGGPGVDDGDRYIEYWNLVFPQFFYTEAGNYDDLPRPGIDTGMGLERIAFILQGAEDNFHTDEFLPIRNAVERVLSDGTDREAARLAVNATADHVRALTFALAEGIMPGSEGRGYVLRRILRRALTKIHPFGVHDPFLADVVDQVVRVMGGRYPELGARASLIKEMITAEEVRFLSTLEQGMDRLGSLIDDVRKSSRTIPGNDAFQLYDTFGFPFELTAELAEEQGIGVDVEGFNRAMAQQKERARSKARFHSGADESEAFSWVGDTHTTEFKGYEDLNCEAKLEGFRLIEQSQRGGINGHALEFVADETVFYPEGGGQVGDRGVAQLGQDTVAVVDAYRHEGAIAHVVPFSGGRDAAEAILAEGNARLRVDRDNRRATERNHTATHLVHAALREVLGDHVTQAGSLVTADRLRFDFTHFQAVKPDELERIEKQVNDAILEDLAVTYDYFSYKDAIATGAMALFGEKYGDTVRVVSIDQVSKELCGGTHTRRTGEIGAFIIRSEGAVGSGVRRVEALTGRAALEHVRRLAAEREHLARALGVGGDDIATRVQSLLGEIDALQKKQREVATQAAKEQAAGAMSGAEQIGGINLVASTVSAEDVPALRSYGDEFRNKLKSGIALLCQDADSKPVVLLVVSDDLIQNKSVKAGDLTRQIADELGFRGGGKPHMAQVGIPSRGDFDKVVAVVRDAVARLAG